MADTPDPTALIREGRALLVALHLHEEDWDAREFEIDHYDSYIAPEDWAFIARARTLVPALCDALEAAVSARTVAERDLYWSRAATEQLTTSVNRLREEADDALGMTEQWRKHFEQAERERDEARAALSTAIAAMRRAMVILDGNMFLESKVTEVWRVLNAAIYVPAATEATDAARAALGEEAKP